MARPPHEQAAIDRLRAAGLTPITVATLTRAGFWCRAGIEASSDESLLAAPGIGPATLQGGGGKPRCVSKSLMLHCTR